MILLTLIMAFFICWLSIPRLIVWAKNTQKFDHQDERKTHDGQISALGGVGIFIALGVTYLMSSFETNNMWSLFAAMGVLFVVSIRDDLKGLSAYFRLFIQFALASWLYLQGWALPVPLSYPFTLIFILLFINAYNFIDGINGLAGTLGLLAMVCFGVLFTIQADYSWACFCAAYVGALSGFLRFNFGSRAQIFMGDNGSTLLGMSIAICFLKMTSQVSFMSNSMMVALTVVALPVLDLGRIVLTRLWQGRSPLEADRQHFHHFLIDYGWSAPRVCLFVAATIAGVVLVIPLVESPLAKIFLLIGGLGQLYVVAWRQRFTITNDSIPLAKEQKIVSPVE